MQREIVCISCPIGCRLTVTWNDDKDILIDGNGCPRGKIYGREEILAPKRVVTATCSVEGSEGMRVPVKTDAPLSKGFIDALLNEIYSREISRPVRTGDRIIENIGGTGVNLVASAPAD